MKKYMLVVSEKEAEHQFFEYAIDSLPARYRLLSAYNGRSGLIMFRKIRPACVFINFGLNDMNGLSCLQRMKSMKGMRNIPIYIYHHRLPQLLVAQAEQLGAAGCISGYENANYFHSAVNNILLGNSSGQAADGVEHFKS
jgi:DNA-binding NarL/FixJ family response regulator